MIAVQQFEDRIGNKRYLEVKERGRTVLDIVIEKHVL